MIHQAGDLGVTLDTGTNEAGLILQRKEKDGWRDFMPDGRPLGEPKKLDSTPPGVYRMVSFKNVE